MLFDYKTGNASNSIVPNKFFDTMSNGFDRQNIKKAISSMQLPLYKNIFEKETGFAVLECGVYDIKKTEIIKFPKKKEIYDKCIDAVRSLLDEINAGEIFEFDEEDKVNCKICEYFYICT
jgi:CRISPR/Cas system-associated exonuclease Cas4 (RecB family)